MNKSLSYSVQSQVGLRPNNEDAAYSGPRLLALADGMGGHAAGEVAASLVISELAPLDQQPFGDPLRALREATRRANVAIADHVAANPEHEGMGTTLTALLFAGDNVGLIHVGDSRAYLMRDGSLSQITKDDTLVQHLVDEGRLTHEEARNHPQRSMVLKVLTGQEVEPSVKSLQAEPRDRYLICSDGLTDYVPVDAISDALSLPNPQQCTQALIRLALQRGSQDNITCIVADVVQGESGYNIALLTGAAGRDATLVRV
jgi:serine/threonine protein phosphatase PrpC